MTLNIPDTVPAAALSNNRTISDVVARRNQMEQAQMATQQLSTDYQNLFGRIGNVQSTPLSNPEQFINQLLLNRPTETQQTLDTARQNAADTTRDFAGAYTEAGEQARQDFDVTGLQANLAETRNRIADRTVKLRETLRDFESNAERRGVAREFVDAEKQKVQADAAAELADLAIIESAQLGNIQQAQAEVDRVLEEKRLSFEFETRAIEQEIARLEAMDTREADIRKEQLQIALTERARNIETALANEKEARGYLVDAAVNGADMATLDAIRNAKTPGEAALLAGPWIGRLDRMQAEASIANTYNQITDRNERLKLAKAAALLDDATASAAGLAENEVAAEKALGMFSMLNELATHPGFGTAVGPNPFARGLSPQGTVSAFITGDRSEFRSLADQIANTLTLDNMDKLKGPATDKDVELVANSVSKLKNYDLSQEAYMREITRISEAMKRIAIQKGVTEDQLQFYGIADEAQISEFDQMWGSPQSTSSVIMSSTF